MANLNLQNPSGFNKFWEDVVDQFRKEAIDDPIKSGNLQAVESHVTGPVNETDLRAQNAFPFVWSVPQNHSPAYATISTDQGDLQMQVVCFAQDTDPQRAFDEARALLGRIVNNVEMSALVDSSGTAHASQVRLDNFQMDIGIGPGSDRAQVRSSQGIFAIEVERQF